MKKILKNQKGITLPVLVVIIAVMGILVIVGLRAFTDGGSADRTEKTVNQWREKEQEERNILQDTVNEIERETETE